MPKLSTDSDFKIGDDVLVKYEDEIMPGKIIKLRDAEKGSWFWKKTVRGAVVVIRFKSKFIFSPVWTEYTDIKWYPLNELM